MLHSTFWNHGAGALDLPPWAVSMLPKPSDLPFRHDSEASAGARGPSNVQAPGAHEGVFLDFLYPPQALAWLQRASVQQQLQKWEKRNMRRMPEGFVVAARGYASQSQRRRALAKDSVEETNPGFQESEDHYKPFESPLTDLDDRTMSEKKVAASRENDVPADQEPGDGYERLESLPRKRKDYLAPKKRAIGMQDELNLQSQQPGGSYMLFRPPTLGATERQASKMEDASFGGELERDNSTTDAYEEQTVDENDNAFAISPGDLAENTPNLLISLRNLLMLNRGAKILKNREIGQRLVQRAWAMYESLHDEARDDPKLKRELLEWLASQQDEVAASHCEELYQSIPTGQRTLEIYDAMAHMYLRLGKLTSASLLHHESLQTLENGHMITKRLFEHAIEHHRWDFAIQTASQHHKRYIELSQEYQIRLFWLRVSEMGGLLENAVRLFRYLGRTEGLKSVDQDSHAFGLRFFREAFAQLSVAARNETGMEWSKTLRRPSNRKDVISMLQLVAHTEDDATRLLEDLLLGFLSRRGSEYPDHHEIISALYWEYRKLADIRPSTHLLGQFLWKLSWYESDRNINESSPTSVTTRDIIKDWTSLYGKPSKEAFVRLIGCAAYSGRVEDHESLTTEFRSTYPTYQDWKESLWTSVYLYAQRADLDSAQQAFATVKRTMGEYGDEPDVKCWGVLFFAHARADDLEGAFTNFQSMAERMTPDEMCFSPIFTMLSRRGDVEGIEDFMEQFDEIVGAKRSTFMVLTHMNAYIYQDDVQTAESLLRDAIPKVRAGEIKGYLTRCFNALLQARARRHDLDAAMKTYQWMRSEDIQLNSDTFAAVMMALANFRRHEDALRILRVDMKDHGIEPTAFHFSIIMQRLVQNTDFKYALQIHEEMVGRNIKPSVASNALYLKAKAHLEHFETFDDRQDDGQPMPLETSLKTLEDVLERHNGEEVATHQTAFLVGLVDNTDADPSPYFEALISLHGKRGCFEAVKSLFARYKEVAQGRGGDDSKLPISLTSSLMSAHWRAGEYEQVEEYWKLAKERADEVSLPTPVPSFRYLVAEKALEAADPFTLHPSSDPYPGPELDRGQQSGTTTSPGTQTLLTDKDAVMKIRPAAPRRHILNQPLRWYLAALNSQSRVIDAIQTVSRLLMQGYTMDKHTWNSFICSLLDTTPPLALIAFTLTERFLTPGFPGWLRGGNVCFPEPRRARYEGLMYINARYVEPGRLMPQYNTLVRLGAALLDVRRLESEGRRGVNTNVPPELQKFIGTTKEIRKIAAKTLHVVQSIPYIIGDKSQARYLRRRTE